MQQQLDQVKSEMKGKYEVLGLRQPKRESELSFQTFFYLNSQKCICKVKTNLAQIIWKR